MKTVFLIVGMFLIITYSKAQIYLTTQQTNGKLIKCEIEVYEGIRKQDLEKFRRDNKYILPPHLITQKLTSKGFISIKIKNEGLIILKNEKCNFVKAVLVENVNAQRKLTILLPDCFF
ncbi:MAG: hypothetical protein MUC49_14935 [Raineya sp.]|jgi:hypothetical protein|nr:hypothetical protein [Raineya sp.]